MNYYYTDWVDVIVTNSKKEKKQLKKLLKKAKNIEIELTVTCNNPKWYYCPCFNTWFLY